LSKERYNLEDHPQPILNLGVPPYWGVQIKLNVMIFIGSTETFNKDGEPKLDKNDKPAVAVRALTGDAPRGLNVIAGTVAENAGFQPQEMYLIDAQESGEYPDPETGELMKSYNFNVLKKLELDVAWSMLRGCTAPKLVHQPKVRTAQAEPAELGTSL